MTSDATWYHGSHHRLDVLRVGSTITQDRELARAFSHQPTLVAQDEDADGRRVIKHNGERPGLLYRVAERVEPDDVYPHPTTTMAPGQEWMTRRELRIEMVEPTQVIREELLAAAEISVLRRRLQAEVRDA